MNKTIQNKKDKIRSFIISLFFAIVLFCGYQYFGNYLINFLWIFDLLLFALLFFVVMLIAGFAVLKSLFIVSAELSLLIFLAQSYCNISIRSIDSDNALKGLLSISILYIGGIFFKTLYITVRDYYKKVEKDPLSFKKMFLVSFFIFFIAVIIWQIYLVMDPIIQDLCIYK
ncbi:MAG: hypothetical protein WC472_00190 [Candidatus Paceibacterota bacterium]